MGVGGGVQRIEVTERDTSVFGGAELGAVGIYEQLPDSVPLAPLLASGSDLKDISDHPNFDDGGRPGTYANGTKGNKIDYLLMSPALFAGVERGGGVRKGVWGGKKRLALGSLPGDDVCHTGRLHHAAIWADTDP